MLASCEGALLLTDPVHVTVGSRWHPQPFSGCLVQPQVTHIYRITFRTGHINTNSLSWYTTRTNMHMYLRDIFQLKRAGTTGNYFIDTSNSETFLFFHFSYNISCPALTAYILTALKRPIKSKIHYCIYTFTLIYRKLLAPNHSIPSTGPDH